MDQPEPKSPSEPLIRLYPPGPPPGPASAGRPLPQFVLKDDGKDISDEFLLVAIPPSPLHICPICDYNLTGLKRRRCPECGELFELHEARRAGSRSNPRMRSDRIAMGLSSASLVTGLILFFGSIGVGSLLMRDAPGYWSLWFVIAGALVATWVIMYRVFFGRHRPYTILLAGLLMATIVGMILIIAN